MWAAAAAPAPLHPLPTAALRLRLFLLTPLLLLQLAARLRIANGSTGTSALALFTPAVQCGPPLSSAALALGWPRCSRKIVLEHPEPFWGTDEAAVAGSWSCSLCFLLPPHSWCWRRCTFALSGQWAAAAAAAPRVHSLNQGKLRRRRWHNGQAAREAPGMRRGGWQACGFQPSAKPGVDVLQLAPGRSIATEQFTAALTGGKPNQPPELMLAWGGGWSRWAWPHLDGKTGTPKVVVAKKYPCGSGRARSRLLSPPAHSKVAASSHTNRQPHPRPRMHLAADVA